MQNRGSSELLTPAEAAYYLARRGVRLSAESVRNRADAGTLLAHRTPSGRRLIPRDALDRLVEATGKVRP